MIRPIDLQSALISAQSQPALHRTEPAARVDAQATQAAFAAELAERDAAVAAPAQAQSLENRVGAKEESGERRDPRGGKRRPGVPFEQVVDDAADASEEAPHIVDFTA